MNRLWSACTSGYIFAIAKVSMTFPAKLQPILSEAINSEADWQFCDSPRGAYASANFYSLIETAKLNGLDPYGYLRYVLSGCITAETEDDWKTLLPQNFPGYFFHPCVCEALTKKPPLPEFESPPKVTKGKETLEKNDEENGELLAPDEHAWIER